MTTVALYIMMMLSRVHDMENACIEVVESAVLHGDTYTDLVDESHDTCTAWIEMSRLFDTSDEDSIVLE